MREICSLLFSYSFILYLVLFVLEIIFPGFVSNNFSLNYILIPTFIFGALSAVFPQPEEETKAEKPVAKFDLILLVVLAIGSFLLIFYKFKIESFLLKFTVSLLSSGLTFILGIVLLYFPDEAEEKTGKEVEVNWLGTLKRLSLSRLAIPVPVALVFLLLTLIFIPKNTMKLLRTPAVVSTPTPAPVEEVLTDLPPVDPNVRILVYNAGAETGDAVRYASVFKNNGFKQVTAADYPQADIANTQIMFRPSEASQAAIIKDFLSNIYSTVIETPYATDSADIQVILGSYLIPEENPEALFENEDIDFFFQ